MATFSMGCFWGPDGLFGVIPGVLRTRVGYAGGTTPNPTYHQLGDHIETVQMDFDASKINYQSLLEVFWQGHSPQNPPFKRQYMSAIFVHDEQQRELALASKIEREKQLAMTLYAEIMPYERFYLAEDYHQKYALRQVPEIMREYQQHYPTTESLIDATEVARVNGYLSGYGERDLLLKQINQFQLSEAAKSVLLARCRISAS